MNRELIHRDRDKWIESYLRNELSEPERERFEEHLLSCAECRKQVTESSRIHGSMESYGARTIFRPAGTRDQRSKKLKPWMWYVAAAAGVALVIGLFFLPDQETPSNFSQKAPTEGMDTQEDSTGVTETGREDIPPPARERIANLESFRANPVYENQIGIHVRAGNLLLESPLDSIECRSGSSVEIRYRGAGADTLFFVLLDNLGNILSEEKIASPYSFTMQFPEGLYYWQLTDEEESLHTGKIFIR